MSAALHLERSGRLGRAMAEAGLDLLVVPGDAWHSDYLRYALDVTPMEGLAIACIERDGSARLFVNNPAEAARLAEELPSATVSWSGQPSAEVRSWLAARGAIKAAMVAPGVAPSGLARGALGDSMAEATAWYDRLMVNKSTAEADAVTRATALADAGYEVFQKAARVGCSEYELSAEVEAWFRSQGCPENFVILGTGGREVRGMHPPGERRILAGDLVTTELTPCVDGYYAQICRTLVVGEPTDVQLRAYAVYQEALEAGIATVRPGATHGDVARAQNDVFRRHGLGDYVSSAYTRVRGHGVGLFVDGPHVLENVDLVLEPDMTLIVHPNTYHPEAGYMVLGDMVRVTATGWEVLTKTPRHLITVPA